jgi:hypothetical protein
MRDTQKQSLNNEYRRRFNDLTHIVNNYDPMGLIASHAPPDEYSEEVAAILARLRAGHGLDDVRDLVTSTLDFSVHRDSSERVSDALSREIRDWWMRENGCA